MYAWQRHLWIALWLTMAACHVPTVEAPAQAPQVQWQSWSKATFDRARRERRILLINVVARWCHYCHVMDEKTYTDPKVREVLARDFVVIRVDSDARPDLAERYREWGWPATALLTPDAEPVLELRGYQPPDRFLATLLDLVRERDQGELVRREPAPGPTPPADASLTAIVERTRAQLDRFYDESSGGWGRRQKYPFADALEHALFRAHTRGEAAWRQRALTTLTGFQRLIDPVWGGMYQYSIKGTWNEPHYEKIAAIQAGAIVAFVNGVRATGDQQWLDAAQAVAGYLRRFMKDESGGFYTSQDADLRVPGREAVVGHRYYHLGETERLALGTPTIDRNIYADLNGAVIFALVELHLVSGNREPLDMALASANRIVATHARPDGGFVHSEQPAIPQLRYLADQAAMGRAMLALFRATGDRRWLDRSRSVADFMLHRLQDDRDWFWAHTPDPNASGAFARPRAPLQENGLAARFLVELHRYVDNDGTKTPYIRAARRALLVLGDPSRVQAEGKIVGSYLMALEELLAGAVDVTLVADTGDPEAMPLWRAIHRFADPRMVIERSAPGERYPGTGRPAVYLCTDTACSTPIVDPEQFTEQAAKFIGDNLNQGE